MKHMNLQRNLSRSFRFAAFNRKNHFAPAILVIVSPFVLAALLRMASDKPTQPLLMIPGPIEFSDDVLRAVGEQSLSHVDPAFIESFGESLQLLRKVFVTESAQPIVISGSGTLGWDQVACNLMSVGDKALIVNTGYFGEHFGEAFNEYGIETAYVRGSVLGDAPSIGEIEGALSAGKFRVITITHVDTSTGVLTDVKAISAAVKRVSPDTLIVVDGVCASGAEELRMDEWGIDVVLTASQKALGVPPGLSILVASQRALEVHRTRTNPIRNYYCNWKNWVPIMQAYEGRKPSYFATPAVNLVRGLQVSLKEMLADGIDARFEAHRKAGAAVRRALTAMGLEMLPVSHAICANAMSAIRLPKGVAPTDLLPKIRAAGAVVAGGLHPLIKNEYFRIGHMGVSATAPGWPDVVVTINAVETALIACGVKVTPGSGVAALNA